MSSFISIVCPEAALLLTDGATYDDDFVVRKVAAKVKRAASAPLAVTARGHAEGGEMIATMLCERANRDGAAAVIGELQEFADNLRGAIGDRFAGADRVQVLVSAFIPGIGGVHRAFASEQIVSGHDSPAYHVYDPPAIFATGPFCTSEQLWAAGIEPKGIAEDTVTFVRRAGADIMEFMRKRPCDLIEGGSAFAIGGRCDLTICDAAGSRLETLRVWDDKIGEKIDPYGMRNTVTEMRPRQNRHDRRAAARA